MPVECKIHIIVSYNRTKAFYLPLYRIVLNVIVLLLGRDYLEKYKLDSNGDRSKLMTRDGVQSFKDREVKIDEWNGKVRSYLSAVDENILQDRDMVFVVQASMFLTYTTDTRQLSVLVSYNY